MPVLSICSWGPTRCHMGEHLIPQTEPPQDAHGRQWGSGHELLAGLSMLPQASPVHPHLFCCSKFVGGGTSVNNQVSCKMSRCIQDSVVKCFLLCAKNMIKDTCTINGLTALIFLCFPPKYFDHGNESHVIHLCISSLMTNTHN